MKIPLLFYSKENCIDAIAALNVRVTAISLENYLYNHPDYPGILSISDTPADYKIKNTPIKSYAVRDLKYFHSA
jgi:hypothetical protein